MRTAPEVGWDDDPVVAGWPGLEPLAGDVTADACVVGLGGSGLAAVEALADRGLSVVGVDAGRVAAAAAGRNAGFLLGGTAPSLHDAIERWGEQPALQLYRATLQELDRLHEQLGPQVVRRSGSIRLAGLPGAAQDSGEQIDRMKELADCAVQLASLRAHGIAAQEYDGELGRGLYLPDDGSTNPARRAVELTVRLAGRARLAEHTTVGSVAAGRVVTDRGTISAGLVVVAVDGRLGELVPDLSGRVRTARLQMLATQPGLPPRLPCPVYCRWGYDYAQQTADGRIYAGGGRDQFAEQEWTSDSRPTAPVQEWIEQVAARLAGGPISVTRRWAASVGYTEDQRPLCCEVDDGVVACGGYSGTGNLVGPVTTRAAVAWLLDRTPRPDWAAT